MDRINVAKRTRFRAGGVLNVLSDLYVLAEDCPFCREMGYLSVVNFHRYPETRVRRVVRCGRCGAWGPNHGRSDGEALELWNDREKRVRDPEKDIFGLLWVERDRYYVVCWTCLNKYKWGPDAIDEYWPSGVDGNEARDEAFDFLEDHVKDDGRCQIHDPEIGQGEEVLRASE
jgi:hypothetical protein